MIAFLTIRLSAFDTRHSLAAGSLGLAAIWFALNAGAAEIGQTEPTSHAIAANGEAGLFAEAVAYAQRRCVKIYGAGIGRGHGYATGILVSPDGRILTAQGIYLAADRIRVVLPDGALHLAKVDRRSDALQTALLRIDAKTPDFFELPQMPLARQGDWVLAISNLYRVADGAEPLSVNLGIVSLRTRLAAKRGTQDVPYDGEVLVIDAITSNPGAPGGAVVNTDGRLVGMVGKIIESTSTNTRLNYAVPADLLREFVSGPSAATATVAAVHGKTTLGIQLFTLGGRRAPAYVDRVTRDSPADQAGIRKDDLVLSIAGTVVRSVQDYQEAAAVLVAEQEIEILIKRGAELITVRMTPAGEKPDVQE